MTQTKNKMPETLDGIETSRNGKNQTGSLGSRACPRCRTGYLHQMKDIYGAYIQCMSCGHSIDNQSIPETGEIPKEQPSPQIQKLHEWSSARKNPELRHWQRVIYHLSKKYPKPRSCLWPECQKCETNHKCCIINKSAQILCPTHEKAYIQAFEAPSPEWSEMSLPVSYGIISISYFVERVGNARDKQKAWASVVQWNHNGRVSATIHTQVKKLFLAETGLKLEWFEDALAASESKNGR